MWEEPGWATFVLFVRVWEFPQVSLCPFSSSHGALETEELQAGQGHKGKSWEGERETGKNLGESAASPLGPAFRDL
jgi:hypothetical protein